jgi:hypothetical protein
MSLHAVVIGPGFEVSLVNVSSVAASAVQYLILIKGLRCLMMLTMITTRNGEKIQLAIVAHDLRVLEVLHVRSPTTHVGQVFRVLDVLDWRTLEVRALEQVSHITTQVKESGVVVIKARTLIRYAIIHGVIPQDLPRITAIKLVLQISSILREVRLIALRMARSSMQVLIASLVTSGDGQFRLLDAVVYLRAHVSHAWTATAPNNPVSCILVT